MQPYFIVVSACRARFFFNNILLRVHRFGKTVAKVNSISVQKNKKIYFSASSPDLKFRVLHFLQSLVNSFFTLLKG